MYGYHCDEVSSKQHESMNAWMYEMEEMSMM